MIHTEIDLWTAGQADKQACGQAVRHAMYCM